MRSWTAAALAGQKQIAVRLSARGIQLVPDFVYTRTFNGFAAPIDGRALALLERDRDVAGVYPVRAAYPSLALRSAARRRRLFVGRRAAARAGGHPWLRRRPGHRRAPRHGDRCDPPLLRPAPRRGRHAQPRGRAVARPHPDDPTRLERHGTQMAGSDRRRGRPCGHPRRCARRVDPADPSRRLAARAPTETSRSTGAPTSCSRGSSGPSTRTTTGTSWTPHASQLSGSPSPSRRSRMGLLPSRSPAQPGSTRSSLSPAGNEGPAGPGYGSIGGPGGAPAALTVGAADQRNDTATVRARSPLRSPRPARSRASARRRRQPAARRCRSASRGLAATPQAARAGVCWRATSTSAGTASSPAVPPSSRERQAPPTTPRGAVLAGAAAILVDGLVPAGALGLDDRLDVPVVGLPPRSPPRCARRLARGAEVSVSLGAPGWRANERLTAVAPFSSHGLAFSGGIEAGGRRRRHRARDRRPGPEPGRNGPVRDDQRLERGCCARGRSCSGARTDPAGARRGGAEGRSRRHGGADQAERHGRTGCWCRGRGGSECRRGDRRSGGSCVRCRRGARLETDSQNRCAQRLHAAPHRRCRSLGRGNRRGSGHREAGACPPCVRSADRRHADGARVVHSDQASARSRGGRGSRSPAAAASSCPGLSPSRPRARHCSAASGSRPRSFRASDRAPAVLTVRAGQVRELAGRRQLRPLARLDVELWRAGKPSRPPRPAARCLARPLCVRADRSRAPRRPPRTSGRTASALSRCPPTALPSAETVGFGIR